MPTYKYTGYRAGGAEATGTIEADGLKDAAQKVRALGLYPREIAPHSHARKLPLSLSFRKLDAHRLPIVTRQMAVLLKSGVPMTEALTAVSNECRGQWRDIFVGIKERVMEGASLSRAMEEHEEAFPEYYRYMVAAGEEGGTLDGVLVRLADFLEKQAEVRDKVSTAMIYPTIMLGVAAIVLVLLFTFVVPKIVRIFEHSNAALPLPTVMLIGISHLISSYWWVLLGLVLLLTDSGRRLTLKYRVRTGQYLMFFFRSLYLSRFTRSLGFLLEGGLPIIKALELAGRTAGNAWLTAMVAEASLKVTEGASLAASLRGMPPVLLELISTGEKAGKLVDVLQHAADSYESEFDRMVQKALAALEPVMILVMAGIVGFIVFAVLLPMFQLSQIMR